MIHVWLMGRTQRGYVEAGVKEYLNRLQRWRRVEWHELEASSTPSGASTEYCLEKEASLWLRHWPEKGVCFLLHNDGEPLTTEQWTHKLFHAVDTRAQCHLLVGGAYGFHPQIRRKAEGEISLSPMVFNHQLVRLILLEQLYRAFCIRHGVPYHHG